MIPISKDLLQAILNYLATRPYGDVHVLIGQMQAEASAAPVPVEVDPPAVKAVKRRRRKAKVQSEPAAP